MTLHDRQRELGPPSLLPASLTGPQQAQPVPWLADAPPAPATPGAPTSARAAWLPHAGQTAGSSRRAIGRISAKSPHFSHR